MIPDRVVEEVRDRADIVEIVGEHVQLKRSGKDFKGLCPFHQEKTPSFYVVPGKGFYKCFGCNEAGDVFSFLMKHLGLSFQEAVEKLALREGVEIPRSDRGPEEDVHAPLREAVAFAADFYQRKLADEREGAVAREYLERRGIPGDAVDRFLLGWAPDDWRALRAAAHQHGFDDDVLETAGLIKRSEKMDEPYDRLRARLVFPITDARGRVIAFGGRVLTGDAKGPKYLNSPETPLYHKGRELYGLHWAKASIRRESAALVVEGYMDYVSLAARGVENVVATLGTAMTPEQARLLTRYATQVLILYDSDPAGLRATFRSGDEILRAGGHPMVVTLPPGEDPDSVARQGGADALRPFLDDAVDILERKLQILDGRGYFEDVDGVRKAVDGLLPTLRAARDATLQDIYVDRVAKRTGVRRETLEQEIRSEAPSARRAAAQRVERPAATPAAPARDAAERLLLLLLARDTGRVAAVRAALEPEQLRSVVHRELYEALVRLAEAGGDASRFDGTSEARSLYEELMSSRDEIRDPELALRDAVETILLRPQLERRAELRVQLERSTGAEQNAILAEFMELERAIKRKSAEVGAVGGKASKGAWRRGRKRTGEEPPPDGGQ